MAELYRQLVAKCSFGEFCAAYEASGLVDLFDAKGMRGGRQGILYLEDVLAGTHKSVWDLKQYVVADGRDMTFRRCGLWVLQLQGRSREAGVEGGVRGVLCSQGCKSDSVT